MAYIADSEYTNDIIEILNAARKSGTPVLLWGEPGTGKTALIRALAERNELPLKIVLGSMMDPTDLAGLPAIETRARVNEAGESVTYSVTRNTVPDWADDLIGHKKGVLLLDEINNSTPTMQSGLLSLLQGRTVGQHTLPDDVWILAAANEPEDAADGYDLAAPMANRILHIKWVPPVADWLQGMLASWNEDAPAGVIEQRYKFVSFLKDYSHLIQEMPENDAEAGKAWPSRRSWDNAARVLGELTNASNTVRMITLQGLVGEQASVQYFTWEKNLDLPPHEDVMKTPEDIEWKKLKPDAVVTVINRTIALMTKEDSDQALRVMIAIGKNGNPDIASAYVKDVLGRIRTVGGNITISSELSALTGFTKEAKI